MDAASLALAQRAPKRRRLQKEAAQLGLLAVPISTSELLSYSLHVVSSMFVGHLGAAQLAGASLATVFHNASGNSILSGLAFSLDTLASQAVGAQAYAQLGLHLYRAFALELLACIPIAALWWYSGLLLAGAGQEAEVVRLATIYMRLLIVGLPAHAIWKVLKKELSALGHLVPALMGNLVGLAVVCTLCPVLIWLTPLGFLGAPLATGIAQWAMCIFLGLYCFRFHRQMDAAGAAVLGCFTTVPAAASSVWPQSQERESRATSLYHSTNSAAATGIGYKSPCARLLAGAVPSPGLPITASAPRIQAAVPPAAAAAAAEMSSPLSAPPEMEGIAMGEGYMDSAAAVDEGLEAPVVSDVGAPPVVVVAALAPTYEPGGDIRLQPSLGPLLHQSGSLHVGADYHAIGSFDSSTGGGFAPRGGDFESKGVAEEEGIAAGPVFAQQRGRASSIGGIQHPLVRPFPPHHAPSSTSSGWVRPASAAAASGGLDIHQLLEAAQPRIVMKDVLSLSAAGTMLRLAVPSILLLLVEWGTQQGLALMAGRPIAWEHGSTPEPSQHQAQRLAAHSILSHTAMLLFVPAMSLGIAGAVRVGQAMASGRAQDARLTYKAAAWCVAGYAALCAIVLISARTAWPKTFTSDADVISAAADVIPLLAAVALFDAWQVAASGVLRGLSRPGLAACVVVFAYLCIGLPCSYAIGIVATRGLVGLWAGFLIALCVAALGMSFLLHSWVDWEAEAGRARDLAQLLTRPLS